MTVTPAAAAASMAAAWLIINGGENDGLCTVLNGIGNQLVLRRIVLLIVGGRYGQLQVIFRGGGLCPGKDGVPDSESRLFLATSATL